MAFENIANDAPSILTSAINNSQTSLVVGDSSAYPQTPFKIMIDSELMLVTNVAGLTFTVTRAIESTSAVSHILGSSVNVVLTAGHVNDYFSGRVTFGASVPIDTSGFGGRLHYPLSSPVINVSGYDNQWLGVDGAISEQISDWATGWSWRSQMNALLKTTTNGTIIHIPDPRSGSTRIILYSRSVSGSTWTYTISFIPYYQVGSGFPRQGICIHNTTDDKTVTFDIGSDNAKSRYMINRWSGLGDSGTYVSTDWDSYSGYSGRIWQRITEDGTDRKFYYSLDGFNWLFLYSHSVSTHTTANHVGFFMEGGGASSYASGWRNAAVLRTWSVV